MHKARDTNDRIAKSYDNRPWTQRYPDGLDPGSLLSLSRSYGGDGCFDDVLDLGCGTGALLVRAGERSAGRLVGADISPNSCARARLALEPYGDRAEIINADMLDLKAGDIGQFDLIYCTGVIFVVPADVRRHILGLIGQCLRPGGAALISYYAGLSSAVRAHVGKTLRAFAGSCAVTGVDSTLKGREAVDLLRPALRRQSHFTLALRRAFGQLDKLEDDFFYAEMLNGDFEALSTAEINRSFQDAGVEFATYLGHSGFEPDYSASDRAMMADRFDLTDGAFRYALFVKPNSPDRSPSRVPSANARPVPAKPPRESTRHRLRRALRYLFWLAFRV